MTASVEEYLSKLEAIEAHKSGAWQLVVKKARRYAIMKATGTYTEINPAGVESIVHPCGSDVKDVTEMFAQEVLREAERALIEELAGPHKPLKEEDEEENEYLFWYKQK